MCSSGKNRILGTRLMQRNTWFGLVWFGWMPSIGRKVGIPRGILPHVQGVIRAR